MYLGRVEWETVVPGHSTTIFFIVANFTVSSVRADFCQNQARPYFLGCIAMCRMKSLTRKISYDIGIRKVLLEQHFSNRGSLNEQWSLRFSGSWLYHDQEAMDQVNRLKLFEMI